MILHFDYSGGEGHDISVQWFLNNVPLTDGTFGEVVISGAQTTTLTIDNPTAEYSGNYYVTVNDLTVGCSRTSQTIAVTNPSACTLTITAQPIGVSVEDGDTVELTVAYSGALGTVAIQWYKDDVALVDGPSGGATISGATTATLTITNAEAALSGNYYATLIDDGVLDCSLQTDTAVVVVNTPGCNVVIDTQPTGGVFTQGDTVELIFAYSGGTGPYTVQWYLNGIALSDGPAGDATISGATTTTLTITNAQPAQTGNFTAVVTDTNGCTATTDAAVVTVNELAPPAGMFIWYKADEQPYVDGQLAIPVYDASGYHLDLIYNGSSPGHQDPHLRTNILNGLAVLNFNETNTIDTRAFPTPITFTGYTIALVSFRPENYVSAGEMSCIILGGGLSTTHEGRIFSIEDAGALQQHYRGYGYSTTCQVLVDYGTWQILTLTFDYAEGIPRLRSNDLTATGAAGPGSVTFDLVSISGSPGDRIAEVLCYNHKLTDADLDQMRQYLSVKWGIPITV